jgi:hypothetical protein
MAAVSAVEVSRLRPSLLQDAAPPIPFSGRYPVRTHLRPKDGWPLASEDEIEPWLIGRFPRIVDELNAVPSEYFEGPGRPGRGWAGWRSTRVLLGEALAMTWQGEA